MSSPLEAALTSCGYMMALFPFPTLRMTPGAKADEWHWMDAATKTAVMYNIRQLHGCLGWLKWPKMLQNKCVWKTKQLLPMGGGHVMLGTCGLLGDGAWWTMHAMWNLHGNGYKETCHVPPWRQACSACMHEVCFQFAWFFVNGSCGMTCCTVFHAGHCCHP